MSIWPAAAYIDLDKDGKRDLYFGANEIKSSGNINVGGWYQNIGTDKKPRFIYKSGNSLVISSRNVDKFKKLEDLDKEGIKVRVVSAPSLEWFEETSKEYQESVLPKSINARVSIEAGIAQGWHKYVGDKGEIISIEHFGASASAGTLFKEYGFTSANVVSAVKRSLAKSVK